MTRLFIEQPRLHRVCNYNQIWLVTNHVYNQTGLSVYEVKPIMKMKEIIKTGNSNIIDPKNHSYFILFL